MFNQNFIKQLKHFAIFIIIFTIFFVFFLKTISFTIPFIIAFVIAQCTRPLMYLLKKKLKIKGSLAAFISTIVVFSILVIIITVLVYKITDESKQLLASMPSIDTIQNHVGAAVGKIKLYFKHVDPSIVQKAQDQISNLLSTTFDFTANILNTLVSLAVSLPMYLMLIVVTLLSTYFFTKEMPDIGRSITKIFDENHQQKIKHIQHEAIHMLIEYVKAYSFIITISFIEILVGLTIFKVNYALILSLFCWVLELIPVLGIFIVFFPLIAIYILAHNYFTAIGLSILWLVVVLVRQLIEPKIVSSTLDLHPLAVLGAIFIGLTAYGFIGMVYILSALVSYKILNKVGII